WSRIRSPVDRPSVFARLRGAYQSRPPRGYLAALLIPSPSLPGLTGQSSTRGVCLLDRPVKLGDDNKVLVDLNEDRSSLANCPRPLRDASCLSTNSPGGDRLG